MLEKEFEEATSRITDLLDEMLLETNSKKVFLYQKVVEITGRLRSLVKVSAYNLVKNIFLDADTLTVSDLNDLYEVIDSQWTDRQESSINSLAKLFLLDITKAIASINNLAFRIMRTTNLEHLLDPNSRMLLRSDSSTPKIINQLRKQIKVGLVTVVGSSHKTFHYDLNYYAGLVKGSIEQKARSLSTVVRAKQNDHDLVRISPQDSLTGDYCDAYKDKVFSISGSNPLFHPLSSTPSGGPPFHPHCRHTLSVFDPSGFSQEELERLGKIDPEFLNDSHSNIMKAWDKRKK